MKTTTLFSCLACAAVFVASPAFAQDNPIARHALDDPTLIVPGAWNGADLENRSNCTATQNNGSHGTYAEYDITFDTTRNVMGIDETAITGLRCTYLGTYAPDRFRPTWTGNYSCTDGKTGTFQSTGILATPNALSIRLAIKLTGTESCSVDAILGGSRF
jgi:hypothetical protein